MSATRRALTAAAAAAATALVLADPAGAASAGTAPEASAGTAAGHAKPGKGRCLVIGAANGRLQVLHLGKKCGPAGTYHMDVWSGKLRRKVPPYRYDGRLRAFGSRWNVPRGTRICAQLWYHKPGGGLANWGRACTTM
ncbi:hypothetical protein [Bailinhaonella thermotolerans]|uniref:Secreted protein n=1 Tax=Bailinhaonella thermotolerans TaxID=1070861 RepID=A0A3A4ATQ3_9ACTN|nr:hypothetical protein [Bailinhaonella thermotolerans]RJL32783.1 hypothetical protein D5H75_15065 [Bailinhaonella thermotolerans]